MLNESARSFSWLSRVAGVGQPAEESAAEGLWAAVAEEMRGRSQVILYTQDWQSDLWLARGAAVTDLSIAPTWDPPASVGDWRGGGLATAAATGLPGRRTNHSAFSKMLADNVAEDAEYDAEALREFLRWRDEIQGERDTRMIQVEHVRAWLGTSVGHLLMAVLLSPPDPALTMLAVQRLSRPMQYELPRSWANDFEERRLEMLYNWRVSAEGEIRQSTTLGGQGEEWREHWGWLSADLGATETQAAVRVAARLLRSPVLIGALMVTFGSSNESLQRMALAVLRRWLLTLKVMAWLEEALEQPWDFARPQDLACFAFGAVKPDWPRRLLAISHRSSDVKATLMEMKIWGSCHCAIDARYVPAWETNTGMMWGLFAAPPVIALIESPHYWDSIWCRREVEVTEYLVFMSDYLPDRSVLDVPAGRLRELDEVCTAWPDTDAGGSMLQSFPPVCNVWSMLPMAGWEVKLFRAAAALRLMYGFLSDVALTNSLADLLCSRAGFPGPAPTNNPDGWDAYGAVFRDLQAVLGGEVGGVPLHLPAGYGAEEGARDSAISGRIPGLITGEFQLSDVLVALEWMRTEWPAMVEQGYGDFVVINCQGLTQELWNGAEELSLQRGLASIRTVGPLWFLQTAGQTVENWPLVGERPIFTEHVRGQFGWMMEMSLEREAMMARYPEACGLELSPELVAVCVGGGPVG